MDNFVFMDILGVRVDNFSCSEIEARVCSFLDEPKFHRIATVNPEFLLHSSSDEKFQDNLNRSNLNVADGVGLKLAFWLRGKKLRCRYPGADLMHFICQEAEQRGLFVFLAVRNDGLSTFEEVKQTLQKLYPKLIVNGKEIPAKDCHTELPPEHTRSVRADDNRGVVFCNFGAPEQEYFLESLREQGGDIRLVMGVGGSFDYLTDKQKRAPQCMRSAGLEWLWRLIRQPKRWKRIWNATVVFLFMTTLQDSYRAR